MKSSEHVTLANAQAMKKELKAATSIQKRGKYALNIPSHIRAEAGNVPCVTVHKLLENTLVRSIHKKNSSEVLQITGRKKLRKIQSKEKDNSAKLEEPIKLTMN